MANSALRSTCRIVRGATIRVLCALIVGIAPIAASAAAQASGEPFAEAERKPGQWVWIPRADTRCRDGSTTGFGVRLHPGAPGVMIYLQGGGYCADAKSCAQNAAVPIAGANYGEAKFRGWAHILGQRGVFNISTAQNPVSGWHHVFIPYCTGDLHGGEKENVRIPGVPSLQQFVGRRNYANNLRVIAGYFRNIGDVALVGSSAGGAGVLLNYEQTVAAFGGRSVAALVDSSPILPPSDFRTDCLFDKLIAAFDLRLPPDCPACRDGKAGGLVNLYGHLSRKYPQGRFALASQDADIAGVALYNEHSRACGGAGVDIFKFRKSLYTLRDRYIGRDWATFLPPGLQHTLTQDDGLFLRKRRGLGVSAAEWLARINDPQPSHVPKASLR